MPRKPKPRLLEAGEVVSFFEELPVEHAKLVLDIVTLRVGKRLAYRDRRLDDPQDTPPTPRPRRKNPGKLDLEPQAESLSNA